MGAGDLALGLTPREVPKGKLTYEEFLAWCDEDTWAEWVNGEVVLVSPASDRHQDLARFLIIVLGMFTEVHHLGVIRPAPFQMKLGPDLPGREPDLLLITREHQDRLKATYVDGPADLVVEIVSPESGPRDRGEKFYDYEKGGVREYWLIDPERQQVECYQLGADGRYQLRFGGREGVYRSAVLPGFWLKVEWLWQEPLPPVLEVLRELQVI